jgi:hypothetical protein
MLTQSIVSKLGLRPGCLIFRSFSPFLTEGYVVMNRFVGICKDDSISQNNCRPMITLIKLDSKFIMGNK